MRQIANNVYIPVLKDLVEEGKEVSMMISGSSMNPFLIHQSVYPTVINTSSFTSWKSSNPSVASVDSNGRITGNKAGTVTISAKLKTGTKITISKKIKVVPTNQQIDPWE